MLNLRLKNVLTLPALTIVFFGLVYSTISLVNHYFFRTAAHDLGIYNNAMYDYSHLRMNDDPLVGNIGNVLADHFELLVILFSPWHWLFGSWTLLLIQIASVLFGGYGIYLFFRSRITHPLIPLLAMIHFFLLWGVYSALSFDYHNNVIGTMFVPWFFYCFDKKNWKSTAFFFTLIVISKENMALWAAFLCFGLFLSNKENKDQRRLSAGFAVIAIVYFAVVVGWIMPALSEGKNQYSHNEFNVLGNNFSEIMQHIIAHPQRAFALLLENHLPNPKANGIKPELYYILLLSGGFVLLLRPQYLVMLIPIFGQKMFNDNYERWGVNYHYSIEFVPVLTIALFTWIVDKQSHQKQVKASILFIVVTLLATVSTLDNPVSTLYSSENKQFYKERHFRTRYDVQRIRQALKIIPSEARVSAQSMLVPHLALRDYIRLFPVVDDADYIALIYHENPYPVSKEEFNGKLEELRGSSNWQTMYDDGQAIIFKKKLLTQ